MSFNEPPAAACRDLIDCLKHGLHLSEEALETLIEAEANAINQKLLITSLKGAGLISDDTAGWAVAYRWPLKGA